MVIENLASLLGIQRRTFLMLIFFTAWGTPTEQVYLSGGLPKSHFYDTLEWTGQVLTEAPKPSSGQTGGGVVNREVTIEEPNRKENYYGVQLVVRYDVEYVPLEIHLDPIRSVLIPSGVKSYRVRLHYNFNGVFSYEESPTYKVTADKTIVCDDIYYLDTHSPTSTIAEGAHYRSSRSTKDTGFDSTPVGFGSGLIKFDTGDYWREFRTFIYPDTDSISIGFGSGLVKFETDQERGTRLNGGQIGGG